MKASCIDNIYFKVTLLLTLMIISTAASAQNVSPCLIKSGVVKLGCNLIGDTSKEISCIAGIQRQIARSVNAEGIVSWIIPDSCWGSIGHEGPTQQVNCVPPYDKCWGHYCPDKYAQIIKSFVELKASLIVRAVNTWGLAGNMSIGSPYYMAMKQLVIDINAAYDCGGIRRPVIQSTIFEYCDLTVNSVSIPYNVINAFKKNSGFDSLYYLNPDGSCQNKRFNINRINHGDSGYWKDCPDITKIEAKMWFYHLAKMYIDLGYKSIHMGQMNGWAENDTST